MKYVLVLGVVLFGFWLWKHNRRLQARQKAVDKATHTPPPPPPAASMARMVACRQCGLHLPEQDAVAGQQGLYCSEAHRQATEG